jgi:hypothetical protein
MIWFNMNDINLMGIFIDKKIIITKIWIKLLNKVYRNMTINNIVIKKYDNWKYVEDNKRIGRIIIWNK